MSVTRKLANFLVAIVLTAFVCGIIFALPPVYPRALQYPGIALGILFTVWLVSLPIVGLGGLVIGMPAARVLKSMNIGGYPKWAVAGAIAGALYSFLVMLALGAVPQRAVDALLTASFGILPGLVAGLYWWRAVGRLEQLEGSSF